MPPPTPLAGAVASAVESTTAKLLNFAEPLDVALLDSTVNAFYGAGSNEEVNTRLPPQRAAGPAAARAAAANTAAAGGGWGRLTGQRRRRLAARSKLQAAAPCQQNPFPAEATPLPPAVPPPSPPPHPPARPRAAHRCGVCAEGAAGPPGGVDAGGRDPGGLQEPADQVLWAAGAPRWRGAALRSGGAPLGRSGWAAWWRRLGVRRGGGWRGTAGCSGGL